MRAAMGALVAVFASVALIGQQASPPPSSERIHVRVAHADGTLVTGLTRNDFELFEDGQPRAIEDIAPSSEPLALVLLLDLTRWSWPGFSGDGELDLAVGELRKRLPPRDHASVASVTQRITVAPQMTNERRDFTASLKAALSPPRNERYGNAPIWDGVDRAIELLSKVPQGFRRAVILRTAGKAAGNVAALDDVIRRAQAARVAVNLIFKPPAWAQVLPQDNSSEVISIRPDLLPRRLSTETGGTFTDSDAMDGMSLGRVFAEVADDLHRHYALTFVAGALDGQFHRIDVRVKRDGVFVGFPSHHQSPNQRLK